MWVQERGLPRESFGQGILGFLVLEGMKAIDGHIVWVTDTSSQQCPLKSGAQEKGPGSLGPKTEDLVHSSMIRVNNTILQYPKVAKRVDFKIFSPQKRNDHYVK